MQYPTHLSENDNIQNFGNSYMGINFKVLIKRLVPFALFAWFVLFYNVLVILWGAYVRATGSGAGCGSHWRLCNGEFIPRTQAIETIVEFAHRVSSGVALLLVIVLVIWAYRSYPQAHIVRFGVKISAFFIMTESLVGALLVLFEWVALNQSIERVISVAGAIMAHAFLADLAGGR